MKKLPFSVCIITKNNAKTLETCLRSVSDYFDEIVVADTGSSDSTKEIAKCYTDCVFDFKWNADFADARNFAVEKARNDFIFSQTNGLKKSTALSCSISQTIIQLTLAESKS